jgi:hypothetical protein
MQLIKVYLYPNQITAYFNSSWTNERFRKVYNRNIKIYRSCDNRVDLQIRNGDQKPVDIIGKHLVFNLFSQESNRLILVKDCEILGNNGRAQISISLNEISDIDEGFYEYSLVLETREYIDSANYKVLTSSPMYIDEQYGAVSVLEVAGDTLGTPKSTEEIREFSYVNPRTQGEQDSLYFISSIIDARPNVTDPQSLHTFQFYFNDFDGKVTIQGSMSKGGAPESWIDIGNDSITPGGNDFQPDGSSVVYKNVVGKWNWFRIKQTGHEGTSASFTIEQTNLGNYVVNLRNGGTNYSIGDVLIISGNRLGGSTPENSLSITVTDIGVNGTITDFTYTGTSIAGFKTFVLEPIEQVKGTIDKILYR